MTATPTETPTTRSEERAALAAALAAWECKICHGRDPEVQGTRGAVRYLRCRHCRNTTTITAPRMDPPEATNTPTSENTTPRLRQSGAKRPKKSK